MHIIHNIKKNIYSTLEFFICCIECKLASILDMMLGNISVYASTTS